MQFVGGRGFYAVPAVFLVIFKSRIPLLDKQDVLGNIYIFSVQQPMTIMHNMLIRIVSHALFMICKVSKDDTDPASQETFYRAGTKMPGRLNKHSVHDISSSQNLTQSMLLSQGISLI